MSHPTAVQFMGIVFQTEYNGADHVLARYRANDMAQIPFSDGDTTSIIYTDTEEQACALTIDEATGIIVADVPTASGLVTRMSTRLGDPGTWVTIGS